MKEEPENQAALRTEPSLSNTKVQRLKIQTPKQPQTTTIYESQ
jgi:hypothetical protein